MRLFFALTVSILLSLTAKAAEPIPQLAPLAPFIGTWKTTSGSVDGSDKFEDVQKWEWAFSGKILKLTHSVNQGAYYGESLIGWDAQQQKIVYRYVNNAGFYTDGTITPIEDGIEVHEYVRGALAGPSETLSGYKIDDEGRIQAWSKFKTNDKWGEASTVTYERAPSAVVIFKDK